MHDTLTKISTLPILYSFRRCPYAMRARMALVYSQQCVEIREIVLRDKPEAMLQKSPKGTVPVLIMDDKKLLEESIDIMLWALEQCDPDKWLPASKPERSEMLNLIKQCDGEFKHYLDRYKYADRYPEHSANHYRKQGESFLSTLNQQLCTQAYLFGANISLADVAIFPFIRQFAHVDKTWFDQSEYHHLKIWLEHHLTSANFLDIMHKYPQWKEGDKPTIFPTRNAS